MFHCGRISDIFTLSGLRVASIRPRLQKVAGRTISGTWLAYTKAIRARARTNLEGVMTKKLILAFLLLAVPALVLSSCLLVARPHPHAQVTIYGPPLEYGYQPMLYNGYVVYYDNAGIPFYWYGGSRMWGPALERQRYAVH